MSDTTATAPAPNDVRPVIATGQTSNWGLWAFLAILAIGGAVLFNALNASRQAAQVPSLIAPIDNGPARITSPTALRIPERFAGRAAVTPAAQPEEEAEQTALSIRDIPPPISTGPVQVPTFSEPIPSPPPPPPTGPQVVFEAQNTPAPPSPVSSPGTNRDRVTADRFLNPSRTIPQGTVIPAVLETALDSTRPGGVRALVQRSVSGFDGSRILIPRGSRLYGEYSAGLQSGQNRALVQWTRLIRPDGVTIALDSPSSDPLGRAGIRGKVDSKFLQRFGGAILQSVLDIGVGIAVNRATDGVIVALPGSTQNVQVTDQQSVQPTLKVKHGTSVSVFVARDLDFSTVES